MQGKGDITNMAFLIMSVLLLMNCSNDTGDDHPVLLELKVEDFARLEGNDETTFKFFLRLSEAYTSDLVVQYFTMDGSAEEAEDYLPVSGSLTIPEGGTTEAIDVAIVTDTIYETDETFSLIISTQSPNVDLVKSVAEGLIINDDEPDNSSGDGYTTPLDYSGYQRIWQDEFDGTDLNSDHWTFEEGTGSNGWGNNELQYYRKGKNNTSVQDGKLEIIAKEETFNGQKYTSARIITKDKFDFRYGRVDIRARLPFGQGIWPALWMLGSNFGSVGWPQCGEIDIMELVGHEADVIHGTAHWSYQGTHAQAGGSRGLSDNKDYSEEFHVFSVLWDEDGISWLMNDRQYYHLSTTEDEMSEFHNRFFFIFNVAVGGNWPGSPNTSTAFPQKMTVDYIRVFEKL